MAEERKPFLLRLDKPVFNALQRWADDDLRSLNSQIDFLLRKALKEAGRSQEPSQNSVKKVDSVSSEIQPENNV